MLVAVAMIVSMLVMRGMVVAVVAAWTAATVAVRVAAVRRTILLVYQVLDERHDGLSFIRHRLHTNAQTA